MLPILFPRIWRKQLDNLEPIAPPSDQPSDYVELRGHDRGFCAAFFVIGESLPVPISPATVALAGAALCLLITHHSGIDSIQNILRDVDWSTLIFFMSVFVLDWGLEKPGCSAGHRDAGR
jgi:Na+/H+ antiporter NhaD/arsenite permease-like protein